MEQNKIKLKLTEEEKNSLSSALIAVAEDLINNENVTKEDLAKMYVFSQENCKMLLQRIEDSKDNESVSLKPETLRKLKRFMDTSRVHPLAGGQKFKSEDSAVNFLLLFAEKFGFKFLEAMLSDDNFKSVTSTMKPQEWDDKAERDKKIGKELGKNEKTAD